jgi:hypothetical protein
VARSLFLAASLVLAAFCAIAAARTAEVPPDAGVISTDSPLPTSSARAKAGGPTDVDVGDSDSFGRPLRWLGVADMSVRLTADCSAPVDPDTGCQELAAPATVTAFEFEDLGRIVLPPRSSQSLLCHWFSPALTLNYQNPTAAQVVARLDYFPTLTVENPVLATPGLVDPGTGAPLAGRLTTSMTALELLRVPLPPGASFSERQRDSAVCIAGFLTRKALIEFYGLSPAQATEFFRQPTTIRMNVSGQAQFVSDATLYFGLRVLGD